MHLRRRSCPPQGRFRSLLDKCGRGRRSVGLLACGMLAAICRRESSVPAKASAEPLPGFPRSAPMQGLLARLAGRYARDAARSAGFAKAREGRHPHRIAGDEPMSPGILWGCRACGAQRRVPGNSPAALERACGRWGSKRGGGGERSPWPPRRARTRRGGSGSRCARGTGGRSITSTPKVGPSRQAGRMAHWGCSRPNEEPWLRGGRLWRKAAFAGFGCRGSCSRAPPAENRPIGNSPQ